MNRDVNMDLLIKNALSEDSIDCIPEDINNIINNTLEDLPERKTSHRKYTFIKAAAIALAVIVSMGTLSYAATGEIPLVKDFLAIFEKSYEISPEFKKYLSITDAYKVKDKGVTISLLGVMASDMGITMVTKIEYDKDVAKKIPYESAGALYINGEYKQFSGISYDVEQIDNNTFLKITSIDANNFDNEVKFPAKFNFEYKIYGINGVDGRWDLKGTVDNTKLTESTITKTLNKKIYTDETEYTLEKFLISPLSAKIYYKEKEADEFSRTKQKDINFVKNFILIDDENMSYLYTRGMGGGSEVLDMSLEFFKDERMPKAVTIIPMTEQYKNDNKADNSIIKPLKPQKLDFGELGSLEIKKIVRKDNAIELTVRKEGLAPLSEYFCLKGDKQDDLLRYCNFKRTSAENKDEVTMVFTNSSRSISKNENYRISYSKPYKVTIYKDKAVKVDLGK